MRLQNQEAAIKTLETQVGQFAQNINTRPQGGLPSNIKVAKVMGHEQCKAIPTRSGLQLKEKIPASQNPSADPAKEETEQTDPDNTAPVESAAAPEQTAETATTPVVPGIKFQTKEILDEMRPPPPFP